MNREAAAMRCGRVVFSRLRICSAFVAMIIAVVLPESAAATYIFTTIADTSGSQFGRFSGVPSINSEGTVAFFGCTVDCGSTNGQGIYIGVMFVSKM